MRVRLRSTNAKKRASLKCEVCSKVFQTDHGLNTHKNLIHKVKKKTIVKAVPKSKSVPKKDNIINLSQILSQPTVQLNKLVEIPQPVKVDSTKSGGKIQMVSEVKSPEVKRPDENVKYECPYCFKPSGTFDATVSHIVETHSITKNENQISENPNETAELQKPIVLMTCTKCGLPGRCNDPHVCVSEIKENKCAACELNIEIKLFNNHVQSEHASGVERFFYPNYYEFQNWKKALQTQTNTQYFLTNRIRKKQYFRCCKLILSKDKQNCERLVCPSLIITQDFPNGLQVFYYKNHYKHFCTPYRMSDKDKKYSITELFNTTTEYDDIAAAMETDDDEKDLYVQFRKLMESIVVNAAKLKVETLNILHGKALEMTAILTNYDDDEETDMRDTKYFQITQTKPLSDNEITKALEGLKKSEAARRKIDTKLMPNRRESSKRKNGETIVPEGVNRRGTPKRTIELTDKYAKDTENNANQNNTTDSNKPSILEKILTFDNDANTTGIKLKIKDDLMEKKLKNDEKTKVSFNDSYKEFVDKHSGNTNKKNTPLNDSKAKSIDYGKGTKISNAELISNNPESKIKIINVKSNFTNENIPTKTTTPESKIKIINVESLNKNESTQLTQANTKDINTESKIKIVKIKSKNNTTQSKTKNNNIVSKSKNKTEIKSKNKLKETKAKKVANVKILSKHVIASPKTVKTPKTSKKGIIRTKLGQYSPKLAKPEEKEPIIATPSKVDKYEVMEQEDDCNILILKF